MIYSVDFEKMTGKISHVNVVKYLHDLNWKEVPSKRSYLKIFQMELGNHLFQADIPIDRNLRDYSKAMYRAIQNIAESLDKSVEQVVLELLNPLSDIIRVRIQQPDIESGSIFVEDALSLYENTKKLLTAAAMDIRNPQIYHRGRPDSMTQDFVSHCRFGQTEIGSYVVSVVCPFAIEDDGAYKQLTLFDEDDLKSNSFTRQVSKQLLSSAQQVKNAVDNGNLEELMKKRGYGSSNVSVNFLEALDGIGIYRPDTQISITVKWAPTVNHNILNCNTVSISHDYVEPIAAVSRKIKSNEEKEEETFIGKVSALRSNSDVEKRKNGTVTFVFIGENEKTVKADVSLSKEHYDYAIDAHRAGKTVRISGTLSGTVHKKIVCSDFFLYE